MRAADMFKLAYKALVDRRIRSILTILGVAVGSAIVLALLSSTAGLNADIVNSLQKTGANVLTVDNPDAGTPGSYDVSQLDAEYLKTVPGVTAVYPFYSFDATINSGGSAVRATVIGIQLSALPILFSGLTVARGSIPPVADTISAVVGWRIANSVTGTPVGLHQMVSMSLTGTWTPAPVSSVFLTNAVLTQYGATFLGNVDHFAFISLEAAQSLSNTPYFDGIFVVTGKADDVATVQSKILTHYGKKLEAVSSGQTLSGIQAITAQLTLFLGSIGAVSLFVASVGIVNTMYVSVLERTREIGILKAIGYRPKQILSMFLSEAALTGLIGAFCGLILGYALSFLMGGFFGSLFSGAGIKLFGGGSTTIHPVFSPELILFSLVFPVMLATMAGFYPAWRASKMNAVAALKYE